MEAKERSMIPAITKKSKVHEMKPGNFAALSLAINRVSWDEVFASVSVNDRVAIFTNTLINILDLTMH